LTALDGGLACKGQCEAAVRKILDLYQQNDRVMAFYRQSTYNFAAFQIWLGLGFMVPPVFSLFSQKFAYPDGFLLTMGVLYIGWGVQLCKREEKMRKRLNAADIP